MVGARDNLAHADRLKSIGDDGHTAVGWAITALFYAVVHGMRGYLVDHHDHKIASHEEVRRLWSKYPELQRVRTNYCMLKQQSESARYYLNDKFTWADVEFLRPKAESVVKFFENRMGKS